jgi:chorismate mutase/prephenate dehydratase
MRVRICGEIELRIHHTLLGKCPRTEVREVYSKPQALSQCRNWLAKHLPAARSIEVTSTSTAARLAGEKPGAAAIASRQAGIHYGLEVLAENIEDNTSNTTRFAVIGDLSPARTGHDQTAMLFQVEHRPGALADAMMVFKRGKLNLTWIESFPTPGARGYLFFVQMEGHQTDAHLRRAVATLEKKTLRLEILGSFPATAAVE